MSQQQHCDNNKGFFFDYQSKPFLRRLPPVPSAPHRPSRPLPQIPRALVCKRCQKCITSNNVRFPINSVPLYSRGFRGFSGKAALFTETYNVTLARPRKILMTTGAHTMQELTCTTCYLHIGWKIVRAHSRSERWKEGTYLLELESLYPLPDLSQRPSHTYNTSLSSDTDSDCSY